VIADEDLDRSSSGKAAIQYLPTHSEHALACVSFMTSPGNGHLKNDRCVLNFQTNCLQNSDGKATFAKR
jgi:hypothetical protein